MSHLSLPIHGRKGELPLFLCKLAFKGKNVHLKLECWKWSLTFLLLSWWIWLQRWEHLYWRHWLRLANKGGAWIWSILWRCWFESESSGVVFWGEAANFGQWNHFIHIDIVAVIDIVDGITYQECDREKCCRNHSFLEGFRFGIGIERERLGQSVRERTS